MKHMQTLQALSNLTSLTKLRLHVLGHSRNEGLWPLLAHGRLAKLTLHTESDIFAGSDPSRPHDKVVFSRSSKLFYLSTKNNTGVLAAPICDLLSSTLAKFELCCEEEVEFLTKEQEEALHLLINLQELLFSGGFKLRHLPAGLHKLINLKKLWIRWCFDIQLLPSLPSSLRELRIHECRAFKSLPNSLPGSLEKLKISFCADIKSLPKDGLPSSVLELDVKDGNNEELKRDCRKFIGTIPIVRT